MDGCLARDVRVIWDKEFFENGQVAEVAVETILSFFEIVEQEEFAESST